MTFEDARVWGTGIEWPARNDVAALPGRFTFWAALCAGTSAQTHVAGRQQRGDIGPRSTLSETDGRRKGEEQEGIVGSHFNGSSL